MPVDPSMPPLPRDHATPTLSELIPLRSSKISVWRSAILVPAVVTMLTCVLLYDIGSSSDIGTVKSFARVVGAYLLFIAFWALYRYSATTKPFWVFVVPATITGLGLALNWPFWTPIAIVFRDILPGGEVAPDAGFIAQFVSMFFGAGLCEELFKAVPVFGGLFLGFWLSAKPPGTGPRWLERLTVRTPLDGVMFGVASGVGFIVLETFFEYYVNFANQIAAATQNDAAGMLYGLQLLIPRTLQSFASHMGFGGIFGYFIGLMAVRRSSWPILLAVGWGASATIHGLWNSVSALWGPLQYVVALTCLAMLLACILKARQLEAVLRGGAVESGGSILVAGTGSAALEAVPAIKAVAPARYVLVIGRTRLPLTVGQRIDFATIASLKGKGTGIIAEVTSHPSDPAILGLKNVGSEAWSATALDGTAQSVPPQRNVRLVTESKIKFGAVSAIVRAG